MLTQNFDRPWDTLRVIDFAMAVRSSPGALHLRRSLVQNTWASFTTVAQLLMTCVSISLVAAPHIEGLPTDCLVRNVLPQGHAFGASAPELMSAAAKVRQGLPDDDLKINGCAADMWSAGTVFYEMLTGHRAFNPTLPEGSIPAAQGRHDWFGTVLRQTKFVVSLALQLMFCQVQYCIDAS